MRLDKVKDLPDVGNVFAVRVGARHGVVVVDHVVVAERPFAVGGRHADPDVTVPAYCQETVKLRSQAFFLAIFRKNSRKINSRNRKTQVNFQKNSSKNAKNLRIRQL